jgi:hypothetical protein
LQAAYQAHPERFPRGVPVPPPLSIAAWINKPTAQAIARVEPIAISQAVLTPRPRWIYESCSQISGSDCLIRLDIYRPGGRLRQHHRC